jgi:hypothetical protein
MMTLNVSNSGVFRVGISDHSLVNTCRKIDIIKENPKLVETRQFKHFNALSAFPNFNDVNYAW